MFLKLNSHAWFSFCQIIRSLGWRALKTPTSETPDSAVTWPRSRFNTSGPDPLGFDWEDLAARGGYSVRKLLGVCRGPLKIGPKKIEGKMVFWGQKDRILWGFVPKRSFLCWWMRKNTPKRSSLVPRGSKKGVKTAAHMYHPSYREYPPPRAWLQAGVQWVVIVIVPPLNNLGIDSRNVWAPQSDHCVDQLQFTCDYLGASKLVDLNEFHRNKLNCSHCHWYYFYFDLFLSFSALAINDDVPFAKYTCFCWWTQRYEWYL